MQPFTLLSSNVKPPKSSGFRTWTLGPCTLFVGPNRSGKTASLIAAKLALLGTAGHRIGSGHGSDYARLAASDAESLWARLEGASGTASFQVLRDAETGKWRDPASKQALYTGELAEALPETRRADVLPLVSFSGLLQQGPVLRRRAFTARFGATDLSAAGTFDDLSPSQAALWASIWKPDPEAGAVECLVAAEKELERVKREASAEVRKQQTARKEQREDALRTVAGLEQLPALRKQLEQARAHAEIQRLSAAVSSYADVEQTARELRGIHEQAQAHAEQNELMIGFIAMALDRADKDAEAAPDTIHPPLCLCCNQSYVPAEAQAHLQRMLQLYRILQSASEEAVNSTAVSAAASTALFESKKSDYARLQQLKAQHRGLMYQGPPEHELAASIAVYERAEALHLEMQRQEASLQVAESRLSTTKALLQQVQRRLQAITSQAVRVAVEAVSRYLPAGVHAAYDPESSEWLLADNLGVLRPRDLLSGYELNVLSIAVAAAYAENSPLRVLVLDDADLDGIGIENAPAFFAALRRAVAAGHFSQVLVAGSRLEAALPQLEGWTIIDTRNPV